jgi:hypothetical protein
MLCCRSSIGGRRLYPCIKQNNNKYICVALLYVWNLSAHTHRERERERERESHLLCKCRIHSSMSSLRFKSYYMNSHQGPQQETQKKRKLDGRGHLATSNPSNRNCKLNNKPKTIYLCLLYRMKKLFAVATSDYPYHESSNTTSKMG